jgi:hypothetical protein
VVVEGDKDRGAGAGYGLLWFKERFPWFGPWTQTAKAGQRECVEGGGSDRAQTTTGRSKSVGKEGWRSVDVESEVRTRRPRLSNRQSSDRLPQTIPRTRRTSLEDQADPTGQR